MNPDRLMRDMMDSMGLGMPFGNSMFGDMLGGFMPSNGSNQRRGPVAHDPLSAMMTQGGFMNPMSMMMMNPFQNMQQAMMMAQNGSNGNNGGFSYCSSSVTTYTTDEHGRPQVYQSSNEVKQGPGGLKETKSSLRDTRTGQQALEIGHHLNDKAHIKKKSKNFYTGEEEQSEDLVNLDETEAEAFEQNWMHQARNVSSCNQLGYGHGSSVPPSRSSRLALTSGAQEDRQSRYHTAPKHSLNLASKLFKKDKKKKKTSSGNRDERHK